MPQPPAQPKIYHILHIDRLASVISDGCLWSDALSAQRVAASGTTIGMGNIKKRRLSLPVSCHPGQNVGEFVPFYFCSRSIMLYVIHCANHQDLAYTGGQGPIIHLEANLHRVIAWANSHGRPWAFSLSNAGARYAEFRSKVTQLNEVNWPAVAATDFRSPDGKEGKQAEFLLHQRLPWNLVDRIGVLAQAVANRAANVMLGAAHKPKIEIKPDWYY
jgi:hypothetical protein